MSQHNHSRANRKQEIWAPGSTVAWLGFLPGPQSGSPSLTLKASGLLAVTGDKELGFALQQTLRGETTFRGSRHSSRNPCSQRWGSWLLNVALLGIQFG